jgi:hypothetical protein
VFGGGLAAAADGGVVITGTFAGIATFGSGEPNATTLTSHWSGASGDVLIARYLADGSLAWAKQAGMQGLAFGTAAAISLDGSAATITGAYGSSDSVGYVMFGEGEPNQTLLSTPYGNDVFVARYNVADGTLQWAKKVDGNGPADQGRAVVATADVARYDAAGQLVSVRTLAGPSQYDDVYGIALSPDGSAAIADRFGGTVIVDPATPTAPILTAAGGTEVFVDRFSP